MKHYITVKHSKVFFVFFALVRTIYWTPSFSSEDLPR